MIAAAACDALLPNNVAISVQFEHPCMRPIRLKGVRIADDNVARIGGLDQAVGRVSSTAADGLAPKHDTQPLQAERPDFDSWMFRAVNEATSQHLSAILAGDDLPFTFDACAAISLLPDHVSSLA